MVTGLVTYLIVGMALTVCVFIAERVTSKSSNAERLRKAQHVYEYTQELDRPGSWVRDTAVFVVVLTCLYFFWPVPLIVWIMLRLRGNSFVGLVDQLLTAFGPARESKCWAWVIDDRVLCDRVGEVVRVSAASKGVAQLVASCITLFNRDIVVLDVSRGGEEKIFQDFEALKSAGYARLFKTSDSDIIRALERYAESIAYAQRDCVVWIPRKKGTVAVLPDTGVHMDRSCELQDLVMKVAGLSARPVIILPLA